MALHGRSVLGRISATPDMATQLTVLDLLASQKGKGPRKEPILVKPMLMILMIIQIFLWVQVQIELHLGYLKLGL
jgi:hypothetical protein